MEKLLMKRDICVISWKSCSFFFRKNIFNCEKKINNINCRQKNGLWRYTGSLILHNKCIQVDQELSQITAIPSMRKKKAEKGEEWMPDDLWRGQKAGQSVFKACREVYIVVGSILYYFLNYCCPRFFFFSWNQIIFHPIV